MGLKVAFVGGRDSFAPGPGIRNNGTEGHGLPKNIPHLRSSKNHYMALFYKHAAPTELRAVTPQCLNAFKPYMSLKASSETHLK